MGRFNCESKSVICLRQIGQTIILNIKPLSVNSGAGGWERNIHLHMASTQGIHIYVKPEKVFLKKDYRYTKMSQKVSFSHFQIGSVYWQQIDAPLTLREDFLVHAGDRNGSLGMYCYRALEQSLWQNSAIYLVDIGFVHTVKNSLWASYMLPNSSIGCGKYDACCSTMLESLAELNQEPKPTLLSSPSLLTIFKTLLVRKLLHTYNKNRFRK